MTKTAAITIESRRDLLRALKAAQAAQDESLFLEIRGGHMVIQSVDKTGKIFFDSYVNAKNRDTGTNTAGVNVTYTSLIDMLERGIVQGAPVRIEVREGESLRVNGLTVSGATTASPPTGLKDAQWPEFPDDDDLNPTVVAEVKVMPVFQAMYKVMKGKAFKTPMYVDVDANDDMIIACSGDVERVPVEGGLAPGFIDIDYGNAFEGREAQALHDLMQNLTEFNADILWRSDYNIPVVSLDIHTCEMAMYFYFNQG